MDDGSKLSLGGNYEIISHEEALNLEGYCHVAHCGIYSLSSHLVEDGQYATRAAVMMVFRTDGMIGFPGGYIDEGKNDILPGLKRELKEEINLDTSTLSINEPSYMFTYKYENEKQCCHFYKLKVSIEEFKKAEKDAFEAQEYGLETFGLLRVPLFTMTDGHRGLPAFLCNNFIADSRDQLLYFLVDVGIMSTNEVLEAMHACKNIKI